MFKNDASNQRELKVIQICQFSAIWSSQQSSYLEKTRFFVISVAASKRRNRQYSDLCRSFINFESKTQSVFAISIANVCRDANSVKHSRFYQNQNPVKYLLIIILEVTRRLQLKTSKRRNRQYSGAAENFNILIKNDGNECGFFS